MDDELVARFMASESDWVGHYRANMEAALRAALTEARRDERRRVLRDLVAAQALSDMKPAERERAWLAEATVGEEEAT